MNADIYPFYVGGPLDGERVPYACVEPVMRAFVPEVLLDPYASYENVDVPISTVEYRREVAYWAYGHRHSAVWVNGDVGAKAAHDVAMWFECLP